ncbi:MULTISPECIES: glutamate racemase [unclassified Pantoea]|uniref:glutamate racemase n=1 Tax=unclassified Pantoea TaxID=2630326 RepID=UPI001CD1D4CF|nr:MULTISPECIES: glutamate racemase [unclassified Pantoea]MCA1175003.1 glutamate racemase [Pantoea sp. alder69]MCA1249965.1 glutamate racemase [Pantoea sp. alder70]MCA1264080.1 glutamate racemase [Pantoea sp. alder81]
MTIACLHTAASNIALFDHAAHSLELPPHTLSHIVMPHLLAEAELSGGMTQEQRHRLAQLLHSFTPWFDAIVITCSTLGPVADTFQPQKSGCPVYRADRMLADHLHQMAGAALVLCAAESTLAATRLLFCPPTLPAEKQPQVALIPDAWAAFKAGDHQRYHALIADAVKRGREQGARQVALAQVSMAAAANSMPESERPLTIPQLALAAVIAKR